MTDRPKRDQLIETLQGWRKDAIHPTTGDLVEAVLAAAREDLQPWVLGTTNRDLALTLDSKAGGLEVTALADQIASLEQRLTAMGAIDSRQIDRICDLGERVTTLETNHKEKPCPTSCSTPSASASASLPDTTSDATSGLAAPVPEPQAEERFDGRSLVEMMEAFKGNPSAWKLAKAYQRDHAKVAELEGSLRVTEAALRERVDRAESALATERQRREQAGRDYLDIADAVCRESTGPQDVAAKARQTRGERDTLKAEVEQCRTRIYDLETRCDPAGDVASLTLTRDQNAKLQQEVEQLRKALEKSRIWVADLEAALRPFSARTYVSPEHWAEARRVMQGKEG